MRKLKDRRSGGPAPWIVTFSDMMSLLLTFFILLYSISTVDAQKFKNITEYLQLALSGDGRPSIMDGGTQDVPDPLDEDPLAESDVPGNPGQEPVSTEVLEMYQKINRHISDLELQAEVKVLMVRDGVFVEIKDAVLFESGSVTLKASGVELLGKLEGMLNEFDNDIVVEGHTDNVPIRSSLYPSNWELSAGRAVTVLRYLHDEMKVDPGRLSAKGYGEYAPIVANDTAENRARNRRVNLIIVFDKEGDANGTG